MTESTASKAKSRRSKSEAPKSGFGPGDTVTNPLKPDWGPGKVVELKRDVVFVYFRDRPGKEVIRMKQSGLVAADADADLDGLPAFVEKNGGFALPSTRKKAVKKAVKA